MGDNLSEDEFLFDKPASEPATKALERWKVIIVDDEPDIHGVTKLAVKGCVFDGKGLEFLSAYSGAEARKIIADNPDAALMLLDVVMETDQAGLEVVQYTRNELNNQTIRIVLRTGQPGEAPERDIITKYDINDYKEKTELTVQKLFTTLYSSLRSHRDIVALEKSKVGLENVIVASKNLFLPNSMAELTAAILEQLTSVLYLDSSAAYIQTESAKGSHKNHRLTVMAGTGSYANAAGQNIVDILDADAIADINRALELQTNQYRGGNFTGYFKSPKGIENLFFMRGFYEISALDRGFLEIFAKNIAIAIENMELFQEIEETQQEIVYLLGDAVENRCKEPSNHVKQVAEISKLIALDIGMSSREAEILKLAAPLHDVGKIGIPDVILNKPGKHTEEEFEIMKMHSLLGFEMLKSSTKEVLAAAAIIALNHHEKWNGDGYPHGKKGEEIHLYGRIVAVADVFDTLRSELCYKDSWDLNNIIEFLRQERGAHFEPRIVDSLIANLDEVTAIDLSFENKG
ncbi:MAG: DUF3369 domain-containing protein [Alphaproteobacteria bacterium]|nr:DUF3369 domain-containing protein [Alphaproteobacteria bacterium]